MWKYAKKVTMSMKSKYINGTIVTIFRENVLILAIYWQLGVCDNFDNFFVWQFWFWQHTGNWGLWQLWLFFCLTILILATYWQLDVCDNFDYFFGDNFDLGNILAASLWQFFVWQFWSWQHTGSGLVTGTYGGYWTQCGNTMGSTLRTTNNRDS